MLCTYACLYLTYQIKFESGIVIHNTENKVQLQIVILSKIVCLFLCVCVCVCVCLLVLRMYAQPLHCGRCSNLLEASLFCYGIFNNIKLNLKFVNVFTVLLFLVLKLLNLKLNKYNNIHK